MRLPVLLVLFSLCLLPACQTAGQRAAVGSDNLTAAYRDRPLSDFIFDTGLRPYDAFDMPGNKRVFIFDMPCRSWWHTQQIGSGGTPANFLVERVEVRGYC